MTMAYVIGNRYAAFKKSVFCFFRILVKKDSVSNLSLPRARSKWELFSDENRSKQRKKW